VQKHPGCYSGAFDSVKNEEYPSNKEIKARKEETTASIDPLWLASMH
jgi:hypothetical protein